MTSTQLIFTPCSGGGSGTVIYGGTIIVAAQNTVGTVKHNVGSVALHPHLTAMNDVTGVDRKSVV